MIQGEKLYPVPKAVELASGCRPHPSTCHRWRLRGIHGIKLITKRQGGRRLCSVESVLRFNDAVTSAADGDPPQARTNLQQEQAIERAERELAEAGI